MLTCETAWSSAVSIMSTDGWNCQNAGLRVQKASDPASPAAALRFEVGQCHVAFGAEIGVEP